MKKPACKLQKSMPESRYKPSRRGFFKTVGAATVGGLTMAIAPGCENGSDDCDLPDGGTPDGGTSDCGGYANFTGDPSSESYWQQVRSQFVLPEDLVYLNTGTEGSMPCFVLDKMKQDLDDFAAQPMDTVLYDERCSLFLLEVRKRIAAFIGAQFEEVIVTTNTTEGLGWVSNGLELAEGDEIITTVHFEPYNSCLKFLRDRKNVTLTELDLPTPATDKEEIIQAFDDAIVEGVTKLVCFCHINYATGLRMPVKEIAELARARGAITLVDAAHAIGHIDIDVKDLGVDFYATSPHKWLCAPPGTGVLYMRKEMQELVWPVVTEIYLSAPTSSINSQYFAVRGQQCTPAAAGIMDAIDFQTAIGKENIEQRALAMSAYVKDIVIERWGASSLFSPTNPDLSVGMVSFNPFEGNDGRYIYELFKELWDKNIITRSLGVKLHVGDDSTTRIIRICTHLYNDYDQLDMVFEEVESIMASL